MKTQRIIEKWLTIVGLLLAPVTVIKETWILAIIIFPIVIFTVIMMGIALKERSRER